MCSNERSLLYLATSSDFGETELQIKFKNIIGFFELLHQNDILLDLWIYLRSEVKLRYNLQIEENDLSALQFKGILDWLSDLGI